MTYISATAESVVIFTDEVQPSKLADAQHAWTKTHQLPNYLVENGTTGSRSFRSTEECVFLEPVHKCESDERENDDAGLDEHVEAGEVEEIDEIDIL
jgi:hypothetical protein